MINNITLVLLFLNTIFFSTKSMNIDKVEANVESKQLENGKSITLKSQVYYQSNGDCISHFTYPIDYFVITNKLGEVKIYDPNQNTVIVQQDNIYSSKTTPFYFFLSGKSNDMGLADLGFSPNRTYSEKNVIVTEWKKKKPSLDIPVQFVKLVHQQQNPIYMEYRTGDNKVLRKVFYYKYTNLNQFKFPASITDIVYNLKNKDSVISKTSYTDIKLNIDANSNYFNYKVPSSAKRIN